MGDESEPVLVLARRSRAEARVRRVTPGFRPSRAKFCDPIDTRVGDNPLASMPDFVPPSWRVLAKDLTPLSRILVPTCVSSASLRACQQCSLLLPRGSDWGVVVGGMGVGRFFLWAQHPALALSLEDLTLMGSCPKPWLHLFRPQSGWAFQP